MIILKSFENFIIYKLPPQREYLSLFLALYMFSRKHISYNPPSYRFFYRTLSLQKNGLKCTIASSKLFKNIYIHIYIYIYICIYNSLPVEFLAMNWKVSIYQQILLLFTAEVSKSVNNLIIEFIWPKEGRNQPWIHHTFLDMTL